MSALLVTLAMLLGVTQGHVQLEQADLPPGVAGTTTCARWVWTDEWTCPDNVWSVRISTALKGEEVYAHLIHELAHVVDGMDGGANGGFDGSPGHQRKPGDPVSVVFGKGYSTPQHCQSSAWEHYACEVARTGRVR